MSMENMQVKADNMPDETNPEYAGLSLEGIDITQSFESERGRKVVHKVCKIDLCPSASPLNQFVELSRSIDD